MKAGNIIALHLLLLFYSFAVILSKLASSEDFFSFKFCVIYGGMALILGLYAVFWQQLLKKIPLIFAYANKAITVVWGLVWGVLLFGEVLSFKKVIGVLVVVCGIILYSWETKHEQS